jgi:hypothetical protein
MKRPVRDLFAKTKWGNLMLTLSIRDKAGNARNKVIFRVALTRGVQQASPSSRFDVRELRALGTTWYRFKVPLGDI